MYPVRLVFLYFGGKYPVVQLLDLSVVLFLTFWGTSILFSIVAAPICIHQSTQGFLFLHILSNTCYFLCFCLSYLYVCNAPFCLFCFILFSFVSKADIQCVLRAEIEAMLWGFAKSFWLWWMLKYSSPGSPETGPTNIKSWKFPLSWVRKTFWHQVWGRLDRTAERWDLGCSAPECSPRSWATAALMGCIGP